MTTKDTPCSSDYSSSEELSSDSSSSSSVDSNFNRAQVALHKGLKREVDKYHHRDVDILQFAQHVWGLDTKVGERILAMPVELDRTELDAYRRYTRESELHEPFLRFTEKLLKAALKELDASSDDAARSTLWDRVAAEKIAHGDYQHLPDMLNLWKPLPPDGPCPQLSIAKHIIEFKRLPRRVKCLSAPTAVVGEVKRSPAASGRPSVSNGSQGSASTLKRSFDSVKDPSDPEGSSPKRPRFLDYLPLEHSLLAQFAKKALASTSRHYVTGIIIDRFRVTLCYFDRFLVATSSTFSFEENPAMLALVMYAMDRCDRDHAGFDPHLRASLSFPKVEACKGANALLAPPVEDVVGSYFEYPTGHAQSDPSLIDVPVRFRVSSVIRRTEELIGRGTTVYKVRCVLSNGSLSDHPSAFKLSWPLKSRVSEIDVVKLLKEKLPKCAHDHLPDFLFAKTFSSEDLKLPWLRLGLRLDDANHQDRVLRAMLGKFYNKLWEVGSLENFKKAWLDCVECLYLAWKVGKVQHRDISEHNVMAFKSVDGTVKGVLNDWDMSRILKGDASDNEITDADSRIGTPVFMAVGLLYPDRPDPRWLRHDLESLFYILIWAALHYNLAAGTRDTTVHPSVALWLGNMDQNMSSKLKMFTAGPTGMQSIYPAIKPEFQELAKEWIEPLRKLFTRARRVHWDNVDDGIASDEATYGGKLTFKTFMKAINVAPRTWGIPGLLDGDD